MLLRLLLRLFALALDREPVLGDLDPQLSLFVAGHLHLHHELILGLVDVGGR